ncbi:hypothetical protein BU24DRAFT_419678 [Aaosphaeria arxii CBS 175.79]|uniref:Uncharacterized protein n=1 Tax=Aaosphaeria arxii CBS 175.79 TaxID=1450172 RepID=A0A6A5Y6B8_9PLEO|nr:uncharacterized protein BU24DRAFT_419678 [Aaosphaeria arxii CBS 175.79]KAF2020104.1 hypothetical protein BU24DRAFT_419678 [Aaosphaeria arxii CBS 175.79]
MLGKTILPTDEELGKKDDDHKPGSWPQTPTWAALKTPPLRWRRRRIAFVLVGLYTFYMLHNYITELPIFQPNGSSYGLRQIVPMTNEDHNEAVDREPTGVPPGLAVAKDAAAPQVFSGPIKFYRLAASLHEASYTHGYSPLNRNILFAFSNLKSAATLLPLACEMAKWNRNWVHVAIMSRMDIPLDDLLGINGVDKTKCPVVWHDARPDYSEFSTESRAEMSAAAALGHINTFLHPQATITDDSQDEDGSFVRGLRSKAKLLSMPIIEMPQGQMQNFMWMARLDAGSIRNWHKPTIDILIQAPSDSSGGILRLLKSLKEADYRGMKQPRLTIDLPDSVDPSLRQRLEDFAWPPGKQDDPLSNNQIIIRRRISNHHATQEESSIRFLELFYPSSTKDSHVLLLSPQVQLSPLFFQYLKYVLLEYKYSSFGESDALDLMGISLVSPSVTLDGHKRLTLPKPSDMNAERYSRQFSEEASTQFLWQAPDSHAALYFGDKWAEWHSFLSNRVKKQHQTGKKAPRAKLVSETLPAWTEYMLEFMRARGYSLLYPATSSTESLATIHNELYRPPQEFSPPPVTKDNEPEIKPDLANEPFLRAETPAPSPTIRESNVIPRSRPLHMALPFDGDLPEASHLPYLLYNGTITDPFKANTFAIEFAANFRKEIGECPIQPKMHRKIVTGSTNDLFCFGDEDADDWESEELERSPYEPEDEVDAFSAYGSTVTDLASQTTAVSTSSYSFTPTATATNI